MLAPTNGIALTVLSFERTPAATVPFAAAPIHFDPGTATIYSFGLPGGVTPWPGYGVHLWHTPLLPSTLFGQQFWLHALFWDNTTFQVGPTFGGLTR